MKLFATKTFEGSIMVISALFPLDNEPLSVNANILAGFDVNFAISCFNESIFVSTRFIIDNESIVSNPDEFEKQKLAYKTVKHLGLHKPKETPQDIQAKIEANKKNAAYQPSQIGSAPYANTGDFSAAGQKTSYEHMKALQGRLGIR